MTIRVQSALPEDAAAVRELLRELGYPMPVDDAARRLHRLAATGTDPVYLAFEGAVPLGLIALHLAIYLHLDSPAARITALVVSKKARRSGVGACLVEYAEARAREAGCGEIELTTAAHRNDAHTFYRALGFAETSVRFRRSLSS
jgi:GNAT superfamily N-acetyltransferase